MNEKNTGKRNGLVSRVGIVSRIGTGSRIGASVIIASALVVSLLFLFGCACPFIPAPTQNVTNTTIIPNPPVVLNETNATVLTPVCGQPCFIKAANNCENLSILFTDSVGTFNYTSTGYSPTDCVFTKTLVTLNSSETAEMKTLLEGKNMTCGYSKGKFDARLVTTLVSGIEYCRGDLKDALGGLIVFS